MKLHQLASIVCLPALVLSATSIQASIVTFELGTVFSSGSVAPDGPAPYGTVVFDDGGTAGSVDMTVSLASTIGSANMTQLYINFDSALDLNNLLFTFDSVSSTGPEADNKGDNGIFTGFEAFQSDGDGAYDILFDFPPPKGQTKFQAGETVVYTITSSEAIIADSFNFLSSEGGSEGTYMAASKFNSTGQGNQDSAWVGASPVPVPAAVWLFGSGLIGLVGFARRKN